ncbi:MAG TPA: hypothetical protein PLO37_11360 [Candidatus Hydrogenedentes bacterium]|nr:hypothetical protein [Candidatus Hydrogenedentota bacterium]HPG67437.1 hypothetical protein [Candidatus Hydrogenedentota bacterium]
MSGEHLISILCATIPAIAVIVAAWMTVRPRKKPRPPTGQEPGIGGKKGAEFSFPVGTGTCIYSAPAAVFLSGEHAVMYGHPAVYLPLPLRLRLHVTPDPKINGIYFRRFITPDAAVPSKKTRIEDAKGYRSEIGEEEQSKLNSFFHTALRPLLLPAYANAGFHLGVDSDFPVACGMNSSGAMAACLAQSLVDLYLDVDAFAAHYGLKEPTPCSMTRLLGWSIENCFHNNRGSGAGITAACWGRRGRHPIIYFTGRRSSLPHRIGQGWRPVDVGTGQEGLRQVSKIASYMFDPSENIEGIPCYPPPPTYNVSILYSGNPGKTGDVLREKTVVRRIDEKSIPRVERIQQDVMKKVGMESLARSMFLHAGDMLPEILLNPEMGMEAKPPVLESAFHEVCCEAMGCISVLVMNTVLSDWERVGDLMNAYQSLLKGAGVSNSAIDDMVMRAQRAAGSCGTAQGRVGAKITGSGKGGDILVLSTAEPRAHRSLIASAFPDGVATHFDSTLLEPAAWRAPVDGVRREE